MNWIRMLILAVSLIVTPLVAWGMWLLFCASIAKRHGVDALKAAPPIAKAFPVTAWVNSLRHLGPWVLKVVHRSRTQIDPPPSE